MTKAVKSYRFEGTIIKITEDDFVRWETVYYAIPDLLAELYSLDVFYASEEEQKGKIGNWFVRTSSYLNRKHQDYLQRQQMAEKRPENTGWSTDNK